MYCSVTKANKSLPASISPQEKRETLLLAMYLQLDETELPQKVHPRFVKLWSSPRSGLVCVRGAELRPKLN